MAINWRVFRDLEWTDTWVKRLISASTTLAIIASVMTAIVGYYVQESKSGPLVESSELERRAIIRDQLTSMRLQISALQTSVQRSNETFSQVLSGSKSPTGQATSDRDVALLRAEITALKSEVTTMHSSLDALDAALITTPDKALSLPLLRKDLDDFRSASQRDVDSIRLEMGRAYELNKWLIGFLLLAVIGSIVNNLIQARSLPHDSQ